MLHQQLFSEKIYIRVYTTYTHKKKVQNRQGAVTKNPQLTADNHSNFFVDLPKFHSCHKSSDITYSTSHETSV